MIEETMKYDGEVYRLSNLCVTRDELEEALQRLESTGIRHKIREVKRDTTGWPGQPNGVNTVHAVYIPTVNQQNQKQLAGGYGDR